MTESSLGRTVPYRGMTYADYSKILSEFGCHPLVMRTKQSTDEEKIDSVAFKNLYAYVESGFPVLASLSGHVISLIGHSIDYNRRLSVDSNGFVDSSVFLKQFVVVDDNFFPYTLLGYDNDKDNYGVKYDKKGYTKGYTINSIATAVIPYPEKAFLPADKARDKALLCFKNSSKKIKVIGPKPWITRLFLTSVSAFKKRKLQTALDSSTTKADKLLYFVTKITMPHFIWVMEVAPLNQYKKGRIAGEVILDASAGRNDEGIIYMRIGNVFISYF